MRGLLFASLGVVGLLVGSMPAKAAEIIVMDFAGDICGVTGTDSCGNGTQIGSSYASTAELATSFRTVRLSTGLTFQDYLIHWGPNYGDLNGVVYGSGIGPDFRSEITFTPISGFEVQLLSFEAGCYFNRATCQTLDYSLTNSGGTLAGATGVSTMFPGHLDVLVNSAWSSSALTLAWGPESYNLALDNITLAVRAIDGGAGIVPEPASWAMLIAGFGLVGGAMRRRAGLARVAA